MLIHGFQQSHRTWRRVAPLLAREFRLLMPDLPGHGVSGRPDVPYTLTWYAVTLSAWMDAVGVPRAHVCGHSFGGGIAQWMLLEQRRKVNRLALVAPGGLGREAGMGLRLATLPVLGRALAPFVIRYGLPFAMRHAPATFGHMEPAEVARAAATNRIPGTDRAFQRSVNGVINVAGQYMRTIGPGRGGRVAAADRPILGREDPIIPLRHGREAFRGFAGVSLTDLPRFGALPHLDVPARFARDLGAFLHDRHRPAARISRRGEAGGGRRPASGRPEARGPRLAPGRRRAGTGPRAAPEDGRQPRSSYLARASAFGSRSALPREGCAG